MVEEVESGGSAVARETRGTTDQRERESAGEVCGLADYKFEGRQEPSIVSVLSFGEGPADECVPLATAGIGGLPGDLVPVAIVGEVLDRLAVFQVDALVGEEGKTLDDHLLDGSSCLHFVGGWGGCRVSLIAEAPSDGVVEAAFLD
jgi:hypothetical protein